MDITKKIETILGKDAITEGKVKDFFKKMGGKAMDMIDKRAITTILNLFDNEGASASRVYVEYTMQSKDTQKSLKGIIGRWLKKNKHKDVSKLYDLINKG